MIELRGVVAAAFEGRDAPGPVDLVVGDGARVALVGPNGSGKSTLLRAIMGLAPLCRGTVLVDGTAYGGAASTPRAGKAALGYVGQDPDRQIVAPTVFEDVAFGPCCLGIGADAVVARVRRALESTGLSGWEECEVATLSGGFRQRVALAGALAMDPRHLLLDEPCSMLDPSSRETFRSLLESCAGDGAALVHATHEFSDVAGYDLVALVEQGAVSWVGTPAELAGDPDLARRSGCRFATPTSRPRPRPSGRGGGIEVRSLTYAYPGGDQAKRRPERSGEKAGGLRSPALRDVDASFPFGSVTLVCGPNGSGKSTLARLLCGLIPAPAGSVLLDGNAPRAGDVGFVAQRCADQLFAQTVLDDVMFGPLNAGMGRERAREVAASELERVGLDPDRFAEVGPQTLSGGQMRRVAIAGVLACGRPAVVFDEPTVGLDEQGCRGVERLVRDLADDGAAVVVVTHDVDRLLPLADQTVALRDGRVVDGADALREIGAAAVPSATPPDGTRPFSPPSGTRGLDPLVGLLLLVVSTVCLFSVESLAVLGLAVALGCAAALSRGVGPGTLARTLAGLSVMFATLAAASALLFDGSGDVVVAGSVGLSTAGLLGSARTALRVIAMVECSLAVVAGTPHTELVDALDRMTSWMRAFRLPVDDLLGVMTVALRFIPVMGDRMRAIGEAQRARGAAVGEGGPVRRVLSWVPVLVPVLISLFKTAEDLGEAMVARGWGVCRKTRLGDRRLRAPDVLALVAGMLVCVLAAVLF